MANDEDHDETALSALSPSALVAEDFAKRGLEVSKATCDRCGGIYPFAEFKQVVAYCFFAINVDPKILDLDHVCAACRREFEALITGFKSKKVSAMPRFTGEET